MLTWLRKPYPFLYETLRVRTLVALSLVVFVFLFLVIFKPFDIELMLRVNLYQGALLYGLASGISVFILGTLLIRLFPTYFADKGWTIGKEFLCTNFMLIAASLGNAVLGNYIEHRPSNNAEINYTWELYQDFIHTYTVGIFPVIILTFISYSIFLKRNLTKTLENNRQLDARSEQKKLSPLTENKLITVVSGTNNNDFTFYLNDLLFIMADGNYVEFHIESNESVKREIKRNTLSHIENQLSEHNFLFRSHRAYLVNLKKVIHSSGNAQGYELKLAKTDHTIPVSRRNLARFDELLKS